ncbi:protein IQ-domain 26-like [Rutidosis leptorrhynchoides]|uniref:protein IQ-domain 26-like n=1 Tax=Rutidosis leptorrhynchoides TaxID=125765 RepID=UPI003A99543E
MGKTIRWLKALFGFNKNENHQSNSGTRKEKIPSCISRSRRTPTVSPPETPIMKPVYSNNSHEQNRLAMAVATATASAADATIAAAHAAANFVMLTSQNHIIAGDLKTPAAIKIQTMYRGYLSRKALKALKALVKIQALVRGFLVRKEAAETLLGMEALVRARSSVYSNRFRLQYDKFHSFRRASDQGRSRRMSSSSRISMDGRPNLVEVEPEEPRSRLTRTNTWAWAAKTRAQTISPLFNSSRSFSIPNYHDYEPRFSTTQNTPRFPHSCGSSGYGSFYDGTSKDDSFTSNPSYMANTESFRAKTRSLSAPKQRPDYGFGLKKGGGLSEVECGPVLERSKSKSPALENGFKNCVMSRFGKSPKV